MLDYLFFMTGLSKENWYIYKAENTPAETQPLPDHQAYYSLNLPTASANGFFPSRQ